MADISLGSQGIYVESGLSFLLDTALMAVRDDNDIARSIQDTQDLMSDLGFTSTPVLSKNQVFSGILGATELDRIFDGENKKLKQLVMTPKKGFEIKEWSNKMTVSFLASQWLRKSKTLAGASFDTMEEIGTLSRQTKYLALGLELTKRYEMISILTRGFAVTSTYGPGSPSPIDGLALFSASHTYNNGGGTFSNTTSASLTDSNLQIALTALKTGVRMQNGKFVVGPSEYVLVVGLANEVVARNILQTPGNMVGMYSGAGSNAMTLNTFSYKGNRVRLVVIPQIGEAMEDGTTLGNAYNWFVLNPRFLKDALALRAFKLYDTVMKNYENDDNDDLAVSIRGSFAVDHYAAEAGIYGSSATS